jgi:hypothetical protein
LEEVVGSIPTRATNKPIKINQLRRLPFSMLRDLVAFGSKFSESYGRFDFFDFFLSSRLIAFTVTATP